MVDFARHPMLGGYTSLKSNALMPTESKLTGQFLAAERMLAHIKKLQTAKPRIDCGEPHSWKNSSKAQDARKRMLMVFGETVMSSTYRSRSSSRPVSGRPTSGRPASGRYSRSSVRQRRSSFSARSRSLGSTGDDLDDMYDNMRSISAAGHHNDFRSRGGASGSVSPVSGRGQENARMLLSKAAILSMGERYESAYDLFVTHDYAFTKPPPAAFTPRMLKTNATSRLTQLGYHQPPPRQPKKSPKTEPGDSLNEKKSATMVTRTQEKPLQKSYRDLNSTNTLKNSTNTLMMSDTMGSRLGSLQKAPDGVPPLDISLDDDHARWLQEHQQRRAAAAAAEAKHSRELKSTRNYSPDDATKWNTALHSMKSSTLENEEELKYLDFLREVTDDVLARGIFTNKVLKEVFQSHIDKKAGILNMTKMQDLLDNLRHELGIPINSDIDGYGYTSLHSYNSTSARSLDQGQKSQRSARDSARRPPVPPWQQSTRRGSTQFLLEGVAESLTERSSTAGSRYGGQDSGRAFQGSGRNSKTGYSPGRQNINKEESPKFQARSQSNLSGSEILKSGRTTPLVGSKRGERKREEVQDSFAFSDLTAGEYDEDLLLTDRSRSSQRSSARIRRMLREDVSSSPEVQKHQNQNVPPVQKRTSVNSYASSAGRKSVNSQSVGSRSPPDSVDGRRQSKSPGKSPDSRDGWNNVRKSSQSPLNKSPASDKSKINGGASPTNSVNKTTKNGMDSPVNPVNKTAVKPVSAAPHKSSSRPGSSMSLASKNSARPVRPGSSLSNRSAVSSASTVKRKGNVSVKESEKVSNDTKPSDSRRSSRQSVESRVSGSGAGSPKGRATPTNSNRVKTPKEDSFKTETLSYTAVTTPDYSTAQSPGMDLTMVTKNSQMLSKTAASTPVRSRANSNASSRPRSPPIGQSSATSPAVGRTATASRNSRTGNFDTTEIENTSKAKSKKTEIESESRASSRNESRTKSRTDSRTEIRVESRNETKSQPRAGSRAESVKSGRKLNDGEVISSEKLQDDREIKETADNNLHSRASSRSRNSSENELNKNKDRRNSTSSRRNESVSDFDENKMDEDRHGAHNPMSRPRSDLSSPEEDPMMDTLTAYQTSLEYTSRLDDAALSDGELGTGRNSEASQASTTRSHDPRPRPRPRRGGERVSRDYDADESEKIRRDLLGARESEVKNEIIVKHEEEKLSKDEFDDDLEKHLSDGSKKSQKNGAMKIKEDTGHSGDEHSVESGVSRENGMKGNRESGDENGVFNGASRKSRVIENRESRDENSVFSASKKGGNRERRRTSQTSNKSEIVRSMIEETSSCDSTLQSGVELSPAQSGNTADLTKTLPTAVPTARKTPQNSRDSSRADEVKMKGEGVVEGGKGREDDGDGSLSELVENNGGLDSSESLEVSDLDEDELDF